MINEMVHVWQKVTGRIPNSAWIPPSSLRLKVSVHRVHLFLFTDTGSLYFLDGLCDVRKQTWVVQEHTG